MLLGLCAALGVFLLRSAARLSVPIAIPAIIAALLVAMSVPLVKDGYPDVSITATGQKNPNSKSPKCGSSCPPSPPRGCATL